MVNIQVKFVQKIGQWDFNRTYAFASITKCLQILRAAKNLFFHETISSDLFDFFTLWYN